MARADKQWQLRVDKLLGARKFHFNCVRSKKREMGRASSKGATARGECEREKNLSPLRLLAHAWEKTKERSKRES